MASDRSKRTYIIGWDGCGSLPIGNRRGITAGPDRHFKANHRLAYPSCPYRIDRSTRQTSISLPGGKVISREVRVDTILI